MDQRKINIVIEDWNADKETEERKTPSPNFDVLMDLFLRELEKKKWEYAFYTEHLT